MNWGNKLLLTFIVFVLGMSFLVYRSTRTEFELVEKDYYKQEIAYQQKINGREAAAKLSAPVSFSQSEKGIQLQLPSEMKGKAISGEVWFYCAYDKKKDKKFPLQVDGAGVQLFKLSEIEAGVYTAKVNWRDEAKTYYSEKSITVL